MSNNQNANSGYTRYRASYKRKLVRSLILIPFAIPVAYQLITTDNVIFVTLLILALGLELGYNTIMWYKHERNSNK